MRRYKASMIPGGVSEVVHVSQGDSGYTIEILLDCSIQSGSTVRLEWAGGSYSCTFSDNSVLIPIESGMTATAGEKSIEIVIYQDEKRIGTANLILCVEVGV